MARNKKNTTIKLDANLDIAHASTLLESAKEWLSIPSALQLDASKVERVSAAAIQILLALCLNRKTAGLSTELKSPSDSFSSAIQDLQLATHFEEYAHD